MYSWGLELEFGDVRRSLTLPADCGYWNYNECDIVNQTYPYWGIAVDPFGINPPVGGEINTIPTYDIEKQINIFEKLLNFFNKNGYQPTASCVSNTHVHVYIPKLKNDLMLLKKIIQSARDHQDRIIDEIYGIGTEKYLNVDSGRKYHPKKFKEIMKTQNTTDFYANCICNPNKISDRYFINLLSLVKNDTLEFRFFRATTSKKEIRSILYFCKSFVDHALFGNELDYSGSFPKLNFDQSLYDSWIKTRKVHIPVYKKNFLNPI